MSNPVYNVSIGGSLNDTDLILGSTSGNIYETMESSSYKTRVENLEKGLNLNSANDLLQNELIATNIGGISNNASGVAINLSRLDAHEALVLKNIADISANNARLDVHEGLVTKNIEDISKLHEKVTTNEETLSMHNEKLLQLDNNKLDISPNISVLQVKSLYDNSDIQETFTANNNKWKLNSLTNELNYDGIQTNNLGSFISNKQYTITGGFNFSCKVSLSDSDGNGAVLGYNASVDASGIVAGYPTIDASGTTEMEIVIVKDQDTSKVRVWVNGTEDTTTVYPDFTGGRLVVLANPNATFSEVKLTDTTVNLPNVLTVTREYDAMVKADNVLTKPIDNEVLKALDAYNQSTNIWLKDSYTDKSEKQFYFYKLGASTYYRIGFGNFEQIKIFIKYIGNIFFTAEWIYSGTDTGLLTGNLTILTALQGTTYPKYELYSRDISKQRQLFTSNNDFLRFNELSNESQSLLKNTFKLSWFQGKGELLTDEEVTQQLISLFSTMTYEYYVFKLGDFPNPIIYTNTHQSIIGTATNSLDFTSPNLWGIEKINEPGLREVDVNGRVLTDNLYYQIGSVGEIKQSAFEYYTKRLGLVIGGMTPQFTLTNLNLDVYSSNPETTELNFKNLSSFPTRAEFDAVGLSLWYSTYVSILDGLTGGNGGVAFDALSFFDFVTQIQQGSVSFKILNNLITPNMDLVTDKPEFLKALALVDNSNIISKLNVDEPDRFFISISGLYPDLRIAIQWLYLPLNRTQDTCWIYVRVFNTQTNQYMDADARTITSLTIYDETNKNEIPSSVVSKLDLSNKTLDGTNKMVINYIGEGGVIYYIYTDFTTSPPTTIVSVYDPTTQLAFFDYEILASFYQSTLTSITDQTKLLSKNYLTWAEAEARLVELATPVAPTIVDLDDLVATISAPGGDLELSANESLYFNMLILPSLTPSPRDERRLTIIRLPDDLTTLNTYNGAISYQHVFNPDNGSVISSNLLEYDDMRYTTDKTKVLNSFKATLAAVSGGTINVNDILDSGKGLYGQQTVASGNPRVYTWLFDSRDPSIPKAEVLIYAPTATGGSIETMPSNDWLKDSDLTQAAQNATNAFLTDPTQFAGLFAPGVFPAPATGTALNNSQVVSGLIQAFLFGNSTAQEEWTNYIASLGENPLVEYNGFYSSLQNMRTAFQSRTANENTIDSIFDITS